MNARSAKQNKNLPQAKQLPEAATVSGRLLHKVAVENETLVIKGNEASMKMAQGVFNSGSSDFADYALLQLINILTSTGNKDLTVESNAALAMIQGIGPTNELEAMLAAQMIATHHLSMTMANRTARSDQIPQFEANGNMMTKFSRTFCTQIEALSKLRRGGEQIVRHVHVGEGGQAVIAGTVNTGRGV